MDTSRLKKFAQFARRSLIEQVQSKLKLVLADESAARREHPKAVKGLVNRLNELREQKLGEEQLIEQVAYTWFNRFCALRFMDVNQYNRIMVVSPISGQFQPEILAEAKAGHLDDGVFNDKAREKIQGLLSGAVPSRDGQAEAYRLMIVAVCNDYYRLMPYLFERIEDYTELLMPDDLLSGNSILAYTREAMTPEICESVESIGWLYQFYISEKKDQVFEGLKKNKKITPENIPAATQLFTPHWIVRYLVENSLGRLWMLNNPNSEVIKKMDYYIKPVDLDADFLRISSPEELKICDPACGSGHILTYAYDLLFEIYKEANYDPIDIPELILTKNLYGIEIDERAAVLAAFALSMKALKGNPHDEGNNRRRFFRKPIKPNICRLEKVKIDEDALEEYMDFVGRDLFTLDLRTTLTEFDEADNFGSLIQPTLTNAPDVLRILEAKNSQVDLFLADTHKSVLKILKQAEYLSPKYHAVIANPPYLGGKGMNSRIATWAKDNYPNSKQDLFAMFIERNLRLCLSSGLSSMINMQSWMFLSSYEKLRNKILSTSTIVSMAHLGTRAFDSIGGEVVSTTAYILENKCKKTYRAHYLRLVSGKSEYEKEKLMLEAIHDVKSEWKYISSTNEFVRIPGSPIAYWVSDKVRNAFNTLPPLSAVAKPRQGLATSDNDRFLKLWHELSINTIGFDMQGHLEAKESGCKWFPCQKGGPFRRWFGNNNYVVNWENDGEEIMAYAAELYKSPTRTIKNIPFYFKEGISWSTISSSAFSMRYSPAGFISETKGAICFADDTDTLLWILGYSNSKLVNYFLKATSPTLDFHEGPVGRLPLIMDIDHEHLQCIKRAIEIAKDDWDDSELSWGFKVNPIIKLPQSSLKERYCELIKIRNNKIAYMQTLEEKNNDIFIKIYGLENELTSEISRENISLNCNSKFRYNSEKEKHQADLLLLGDSLREFISYAVGCMFGRYSIDKYGLILANQGNSLQSYLEQVSAPSLMPDEDNVIPIIDFDGDWFEDDITERFKTFLKVTFGEEHFTANVLYIEEAIGKDIKKYFVKDFYADHVKRYKKRPIYWLFSSPKGSFNALIYMHRYQPDTASIVLNDYLREFRTKLEARKESYEQVEISVAATQKDITQAIKAIAKIDKVLEEINDYEHDVLYPLAGQKIEIDLDDGVKHNYPLFGSALKKVTGLS
jgi:type II restriction/modification system DNA methylase subunit YeeA